MNLAELIIDLSNTFGVSGYENEIAAKAAKIIAPFVDSTEIDRFGNLICKKKCGTPNAPRLLLDAHLDQIGAMVTDITEEGFLRFTAVGGVDQRVMPGQLLQIKTRQHGFIEGVVTTIPPHLLIHMDSSKTTPMNRLLVDTGLYPEKVKKIVSIGDPLTFADVTFSMGENMVCGKALDDRACFAAIVRALELLQGKKMTFDLIVTGTAKEEVGFVGASICAYRNPADLAVAVDVCHARTEDSLVQDNMFELGGGPVIFVGANSRPENANKLFRIAEDCGVPVQRSAVPAESYVNSWAMQVAGTGTSTLAINLPLKYMHTPVEVVQISDVEAISVLLAELAQSDWKENSEWNNL